MNRRALRTIALASAATLLALAGARPARAVVGSTDYSVTATSGLYEPPPNGAASVGISNNTGVIGRRLDFPFVFQYFGRLYDHAFVTTYGYSRFGSDAALYSFPVDPSTLGVGSAADGICAPLWDYVVVPATGNVVSWTAGIAPQRRFIVSYEKVILNANSSASLTFQTKYYETSGRIEFAYKTTASNWTGTSYAIAVDAPGDDPRWTAPVNTNSNNSGRPANDYRFDPRQILITGRVLYDRLVPTPTGLDTTPTPAPASGLRIEVRNADGTTNRFAATDALGYFALYTGVGPPAGADVLIHAQGAGCVVKAPGAAAAASWTVHSGINYLSDVDVGTRSIGVGADPNALFRAPASVASAIHRVYLYAASKVTHAIPTLAVTYDPASTTAATKYFVNAIPAVATMTVAGQATSNPDTWDDAVIERAYGRHVLASISKSPTPASFTYDDRPDVVTDAVNAFAAGFGCYLHAVVEGRGDVIDTTSQSAATTFDLESPTLTSARGPAVAGWVAAALYDLVDPANESWDWTDGSTGSSIRPLIYADVMTVVPDAKQFFATWGGTGSGVAAVSRNFVAHGLIPDDSFEPNDVASETGELGAAPLRRQSLVLNAGSEDWFAFDVPPGFADLVAEAYFPRNLFKTTVEVQILTLGGVSLADTVDAGTGVPAAAAGPVAAGTYVLRVRNVSGDSVATYTLQIFDRFTMVKTPLKSWTKGFDYEQQVTASHGFPPYMFVFDSGGLPPGLFMDPMTGRVAGAPTTAGDYGGVLLVKDGASPMHVDSMSFHIVVAEPLDIGLGEFVALPRGRAIDFVRPHVGGTQPIAVSVTAGAPPVGVTVATNDLRFAGTADVPGSTALSLRGVDVAGSTSTTSTTCVVCVPMPAKKTPVELHAHEAAVGFYWDAVAGSRTSITVTTSPTTKVKRALRLVVLGPDGLPVGGVKPRNALGKASAAGVPAPVTGRYYAVVAAADGEATQLLGTTVVTPPKKGAAKLTNVYAGESFDVTFGALAGARLTFSAASRRAPMSLRFVELVGPGDEVVPLDDAKPGRRTKATVTLPSSGTWRLRIHAENGTSGAATVSYSYKLVEPKDVAYSAD